MSGQRYVSRELTHFVGANLLPDKDGQFELLVNIVKTGVLGVRAGAKGTPPSMNFVYGQPFFARDGELCGVSTVCFCDIPVADLSIHVRKYSEFGIAFPKSFLVRKGASPVFYVEENSRYAFEDPAVRLGDQYLRMLDRLFDLLDDQYDLKVFLVHRLLGYLKTFDSSLPEDDRRNYYMEREWRVIGKVEFELEDIARIVIPRDLARRFRDRLPAYCGQISFPDAD